MAGSEDEGDAASSRSVPSGRRTAAAAAADRDDERSRWSFFPQTYTLPIDWGLFAEDFRRRGGVWIAKPVGRAQGKGIFLVNRLAQLSAWRKGGAGAAAGGDADGSDTVSLRPHGGYARPGSDAQRENDEHGDVEVYVVQRYLERPLVVGGRKFDFRLYCLVTSFRPLRAWLHREGFCRFSAGSYRGVGRDADLRDLGAHLTNAAISKKVGKGERAMEGEGREGGAGGEGKGDRALYVEETGNKWSLVGFRRWIRAVYGAARSDALFRDIRDVVLRSLLACQHAVVQDRHCFELYGYDVMVDSDLKAWLIEVNAQPALSVDPSGSDREIKEAVLGDALDILDLEGARGWMDDDVKAPALQASSLVRRDERERERRERTREVEREREERRWPQSMGGFEAICRGDDPGWRGARDLLGCPAPREGGVS